MTELNWYWAYTPYLDAPEKQAESATKAGYAKVCFKSEADKKIAKLKGKLVEQATLRVWAELQLRHNKYKRCLIIISDIKAAMDNAFFVSGEYLDWLTKWRDRWITIADKFKEE